MMNLKIVLLFACVGIGKPEDTIPRAKRGFYNGYYGNIYRYVDHTPAAAQYYNPPSYSSSVQRYQEPKVMSQSQFNHPQRTQQVAYTQYLQSPSQVSSTQAQAVVTPVQHSTVVHHTPYVPNLASPSNPYLGQYVYLNGKTSYPQIQVQPLHQQPLQQHHLNQRHPLQKPLSYQQLQQVAPQKFHPSPQHYPNTNIQNTQQQFVPIRNPVYNAPIKQSAPVSKEEESDEQEAAEEDDEEKEEINEEEEEDDEEEEGAGRYQEEDVEEQEEEEEEEKPKYTNYSFSSNSKKKKNDEDEEEEDGHRGGYQTHENVEEEEEDDSDEGSSRLSYKKKTPKNFSKFEKRPPFNKSRPIKSQYERYTYTRGKNGKPLVDTIQGRPSRNVPVTVQKVYKEKWYVTQKA